MAVNTAMLNAALSGLQTATKPRVPAPSEEPFMPDELTVREAQMAPGTAASNMSREDIAHSLMQRLRVPFGLKVAESEQAIRAAMAPKEIEGQYRVKAAEATGRQRQGQFEETQRQLNERQQRQLESTGENQRLNREAIAGRMAETREARGTPVTARTGLLRMRAAAEKRGQGQVGFLDKWKNAFGMGSDAPNAALQQFDTLSALGQKIATEYPDEDLQTALDDLGEDALTPEEQAELQQIVYLLRGR